MPRLLRLPLLGRGRGAQTRLNVHRYPCIYEQDDGTERRSNFRRCAQERISSEGDYESCPRRGRGGRIHWNGLGHKYSAGCTSPCHSGCQSGYSREQAHGNGEVSVARTRKSHKILWQDPMFHYNKIYQVNDNPLQPDPIEGFENREAAAQSSGGRDVLTYP